MVKTPSRQHVRYTPPLHHVEEEKEGADRQEDREGKSDRRDRRLGRVFQNHPIFFVLHKSLISLEQKNASIDPSAIGFAGTSPYTVLRSTGKM